MTGAIMKRSLLFLVIFSSLVGCGFKNSVVKLNYVPNEYPNKVSFKTPLEVTKFNDVRGKDPKNIANKGVDVQARAQYFADDEIANIVTKAVKDTLLNLNYIINTNGDLRLTGDILKFDSIPLMGFWSGQIEGTIQVSFKLSDTKTNKLVWTEVLAGNYRKSSIQFDADAHRKEVAEKTISDVMNKLAESETFKTSIMGFANSEPR